MLLLRVRSLLPEPDPNRDAHLAPVQARARHRGDHRRFPEGHAPGDVHATAKKQFRAVRLDLVEREAMARAEPDPKLHKLAFPAALGLVDAFITHSWQDDKDQKWAQLQEFRAEFKQAHGREAVVWIDKYCIDQNSLAEGLMCLPVFLGKRSVCINQNACR